MEAIPRLEPLPDLPEGFSSPRSGRSDTLSSPRSPIRAAVQQHVVDCTETAIGLTGMLLGSCLAETAPAGCVLSKAELLWMLGLQESTLVWLVAKTAPAGCVFSGVGLLWMSCLQAVDCHALLSFVQCSCFVEFGLCYKSLLHRVRQMTSSCCLLAVPVSVHPQQGRQHHDTNQT